MRKCCKVNNSVIILLSMVILYDIGRIGVSGYFFAHAGVMPENAADAISDPYIFDIIKNIGSLFVCSAALLATGLIRCNNNHHNNITKVGMFANTDNTDKTTDNIPQYQQQYNAGLDV